MSSLVDSMYLVAKRRLERNIEHSTRAQLLGFKDRCSRYIVASYSIPLPNGSVPGRVAALTVFSVPRNMVAGSEIYLTVGGSGGAGVGVPIGGSGGCGGVGGPY